MTKLIATLSMLCMLMVSVNTLSLCQMRPDTSIIGMWQGTLVFNGNKVRIVFHIAKTDSGSLTGSLDSPDQGAKGIPVSSVILERDSVRFMVESIGGGYAGRLSDDDSTIMGKWTQSGISLPLTVNRTNIEIKFNRPQEPRPPYPYESEEVVFDSKTTGMKYSGTLTVPDSGGPFPAAILITGSGVHDRNEEVFGHKPFLVIADYLTRRGIAVLRVDDRGVGASTGNKMAVSPVEHAEDVIAEIEYLKGRTEINPDKIGIIGHSEGGVIAPMVAARSKDVSFVILLAGTGVTGAEVLIEQKKLIEESEGVPEEEIGREVRQEEDEFRIMRLSADSTTTADSLTKYLRTTLPQWGNDIGKKKGDPEKAIDAEVRSLLSPWFRYFLFYDPRIALDKVKCPVLAMGGSLDLQVPASQNLEEIGKALKKGGNRDYTVKLMLGLNHLFQDAKTGSPNEYAQIEETISTAALNTIGDWIEEHTRK